MAYSKPQLVAISPVLQDFVWLLCSYDKMLNADTYPAGRIFFGNYCRDAFLKRLFNKLHPPVCQTIIELTLVHFQILHYMDNAYLTSPSSPS